MPNMEGVPPAPNLDEFALIVNHLKGADRGVILLLQSLVQKEIQNRCKDYFEKLVAGNGITDLEKQVIALKVAQTKVQTATTKLNTQSAKKNQMMLDDSHYRNHLCKSIAAVLIKFARVLH